jgi:membrane-associated HD superfamily phosphohydrolase
LIQSIPEWQELLGAVSLIIILSGFLWLYFLRRQPASLASLRSQFLIALLFLLFFIGARILIPNRTVIPYIYPLPAFGLLVSALYGIGPAIILSIPLSILTAYGMPNAMDLTIFYMITSLCAILALGPARSVGAFFKAGIAIAGAGAAVILAYRIPFYSWDWIGILTLLGAAAFSSAASTCLGPAIPFCTAAGIGDSAPTARNFPPRSSFAAIFPAQRPGDLSAQSAGVQSG